MFSRALLFTATPLLIIFVGFPQWATSIPAWLLSFKKTTTQAALGHADRLGACNGLTYPVSTAMNLGAPSPGVLSHKAEDGGR